MQHQTSILNEVGPLPCPPLLPPTPDRQTPSQPPSVAPRVTIYQTETQRWEYRIVTQSVVQVTAVDAEKLNRLGAEGWELCALLQHDSLCYLYFKRLLP